MNNDRFKFHCECSSFSDCDLSIDITEDQWDDIHRKGIMISPVCKVPVPIGYALIEETPQYKLYSVEPLNL